MKIKIKKRIINNETLANCYFLQVAEKVNVHIDKITSHSWLNTNVILEFRNNTSYKDIDNFIEFIVKDNGIKWIDNIKIY